MEKTNVIDINGRRYDARTGERIDKPVEKSRHSAARAARPARRPAAHAKAHAPISSKLLMRQAVKKPAGTAKKHLKAHGALPAKPARHFSPAHRSESRLTHARHIHKSPQISHFVRPTFKAYEGVSPMAAAIPVMPEPKPLYHHVSHQAAGHKKPQTTAELLDAALQAATSHTAEPLPRPKRRTRLLARFRTA